MQKIKYRIVLILFIIEFIILYIYKELDIPEITSPILSSVVALLCLMPFFLFLIIYGKDEAKSKFKRNLCKFILCWLVLVYIASIIIVFVT